MMEDIKKEYKSKTIPSGLMQFENPYKNAWEELIRWLEAEVDPSIFSDYSMWEVKSDKVIKRQVLEIINEISIKHGIGDKDVKDKR